VRRLLCGGLHDVLERSGGCTCAAGAPRPRLQRRIKATRQGTVTLLGSSVIHGSSKGADDSDKQISVSQRISVQELL
jgi:hypothetical protein